MRRCIYCLDDKPESAFNVEHVMPVAFGTFEPNLVLNCVCESCNSCFGKTLDLTLGRDTVEGLDRFRLGVKQLSEHKSLGKRSTSYIEVKDGPYEGAICEARPAKNQWGFEPGELIPQIGFGKSEDGPFKFFPIDDIPTKDEIVAQGYESPLHVRVYGLPLESGMAALEAKGFPRGEQFGETPGFRGRTRVDYVFKISHPAFRAISKIAFNYFTCIGNAGIACLPHFNEVRRYVREDVRPSSRLVDIVGQGGGLVRGHLVAVELRGTEILAQVSLFGRFRYLVRLSSVPFAITGFDIRAAHVFDLDTRSVIGTDPPLLD